MSGRERAFPVGAKVAVLGLGVSGIAAARLARTREAEVYASDAAATPTLVEAAAGLREEGIEAEAGRHDLDRILACDVVVVSPGIDPTSDVRRAVARAGVRTMAEVELASRDLEGGIIGVTGTNGKTTTTALIREVLDGAGVRAAAAGNIGRPLAEIALEDDQPDWTVVELSSFQLADIERFCPDIGLFLNLAPDHLDRYPTEASYAADKARLFWNAGPDSRWVLNADDRGVEALAVGSAGERYGFSLHAECEPGAWLAPDGWLRARLPGRDEDWGTAGALGVGGPHNVANALAAGLAAALVGVPAAGIRSGLAGFRGLPHRLQTIGERDGVRWVNDSKATNLAAARVAIESFASPLVVILGGRHKGEDYAGLAESLGQRARAVVALGEAADRIESALAPTVPVHRAGAMDAAVVRAAELARPGDVVLLSPACSSYDMFRSYAERGEAFERAFAALPDGLGRAG
ncbi:MAG: UDP-N-acetylmuramoyl-L-alanine--D-glutamate ligase [Gemmatimonadota bacterium]